MIAINSWVLEQLAGMNWSVVRVRAGGGVGCGIAAPVSPDLGYRSEDRSRAVSTTSDKPGIGGCDELSEFESASLNVGAPGDTLLIPTGDAA